MEKTNVMRILSQKNIAFKAYEYDASLTEGEKIAKVLKQNDSQVFKTLVTVANHWCPIKLFFEGKKIRADFGL